MASTNHTQNYNLPQWEPTDPFSRAEFNDAFQKIDTAVAANCKIAVGSYTGSGQYGSSHKNSLTFNFEPQLIFMHTYSTRDYNTIPQYYIWARGAGTCASDWSGYDNTVTWTGKTVRWYSDNATHQFNESGVTYHYVAIG